MAARKTLRNESGQSVLEFVLMLPLLVGMAILMLRVNMAIQVSIANQKYSRAQTLFLAFNSAYFPQIDRWGLEQGAFPLNQLRLGVSEDKAPTDEDATERFIPSAVTQIVARTKAKAGPDGNAQEEPDKRGLVRIRTTVTLCSQSHLISVGGQRVPAHGPELKEGVTPEAFDYCRGSIR